MTDLLPFRYRFLFDAKDRRFTHLPPNNLLATFVYINSGSTDWNLFDVVVGKDRFLVGFLSIFRDVSPAFRFLLGAPAREVTIYQGGKLYKIPDLASITANLSGKFGVTLKHPAKHLPPGTIAPKTQIILVKGLPNTTPWFGLSVSTVNNFLLAQNAETEINVEDTPKTRE